VLLILNFAASFSFFSKSHTDSLASYLDMKKVLTACSKGLVVIEDDLRISFSNWTPT
jgi:hypothetical protein